MPNFQTIKDIWKSLPTFKLKDVKSLVGKTKHFVKDTRIKLNHLSKTNFDLGLYHFDKGNISDAILRFKLLKGGLN